MRTSPIVLACALALPAMASASSTSLTIGGAITESSPLPCAVTHLDRADFGSIDREYLGDYADSGEDAVYNVFDTLLLGIECGVASKAALRFVDNNPAGVVPGLRGIMHPAASLFGLGGNIGNYGLELQSIPFTQGIASAPHVDGAFSGKKRSEYVDTSRYYALTGTDTKVIALTQHAFNLRVMLAINYASEIPEGDITFAGSATIEVYTL